MADRALMGSRIMNKPIPSYLGLYTDGLGWSQSNGWKSIDPTKATGVYHESYFDLSGYELDDLTAVPTLLQLQDALPYTTNNGTDPSLIVSIFDIISQERLNPATVATNLQNTLDYPSSPGSAIDWSQILMCNYRAMSGSTQLTNTTLLQAVSGGALGSSEPTAVAKLWTYRIIVTAGSDWSAKTFVIPATRFIAGVEVVSEAELPYLMRLKRSYELATQG